MFTLMFVLFLTGLCFAKIIIQGIYLIHKLQQLGYSNAKMLTWLEGGTYRKVLVWNLFELFVPLLLILILYFVSKGQLSLYKWITSIIIVSVFIWKIIHPFVAGWMGKKANYKKPLVYTARVKRLLFTLCLLAFAVLTVTFIYVVYPLNKFSLSSWYFFRYNAFILLYSVLTPIFILIASLINAPIEKFICCTYFIKAKKRLRKSSVCSIGITGSFGKTSTKFFLSEVLNSKYKTLTTPSSFNTPMGISKVLNGEPLDDYRYFVSEMGADHVGDITELCNLVQPQAGIITAVGIQHLETFGTPENILRTKLELFDAIPDSGFGIYNYDCDILRDAISKRSYKFPLYSYSVEPQNFPDVNLYAKDIVQTCKGLSFSAVFADGRILNIETKLLGRHNVQNILAVILAAWKMGLSDKEIEFGMRNVEAVEHRLKRIDSGNGILVLDDAFNSNYNGAIEAVNVLNEIAEHKKIVVTPGFVELGDMEEAQNRNFGSYMASKIDYAVLVGGGKSLSIRDGLLNSGFDYEHIFNVDSLAEAQNVLAKILTVGDVVLFENDLPDIYSNA
ncbi:MAG: UDP-N-acetylmuramoyl-tripeptide--D-alanyl-D-alanine ligase [Spirochaetales bacterium]|nr:UDP-N-acetylmuramoyl-tripeptide--D-alanyl-D-alanine ligase [Spirochaetales bacterium]